jgi:5-methylcytosine-specific restriction endonuclease McrA
MRKKRKAIPGSVADEVMFKADLSCCVCEKRDDHIHHLDQDPSNNDIDNLALLCFEHHNQPL